ncbi:MAG TPA: tripartite tricarboxylate transporter TctB family protein [Rubrivivax sp.]
MQGTDRWVGLALAALGLIVVWSASSFPNVPGQKLGAGFLPMLVGSGLGVCGLALLLRSRRAAHYAEAGAAEVRREHFGSSFVIIGAVVGYILLAERLGFLIVAPLCLVATFLALRVPLARALVWALLGTVLVHVAFYKLLRVPLPWGVLRPFY